MAKFPNPPPASHLSTVPPEVHILPAGTLLWRLYFRAGANPLDWNVFRAYGPVPAAKGGRFDHHLPPRGEQDRKIYYASDQISTCIAEVFQGTRVVNRIRDRPTLVGFELATDVPLLNLCGNWPTRAGASMALSTGSRARAQRWSQAIYDAYPEIQGLWYPSSMDANRPAVALYERAQLAIPQNHVLHCALADSRLLADLVRIATALNYALI